MITFQNNFSNLDNISTVSSHIHYFSIYLYIYISFCKTDKTLIENHHMIRFYQLIFIGSLSNHCNKNLVANGLIIVYKNNVTFAIYQYHHKGFTIL